jgi:cystathionine gamma-lyase
MPNHADGHSESREAACRNAGFATKAIRVGQDPDSATGATIIPIYQTATFTMDEVGVSKGYDYSRSGNPTRRGLEQQLAHLEGSEYCCTFASGMAAIFGACSVLRAGDHMIATKDIYGGTFRLFSEVLPQYGINVDYVDLTDLDAIEKSIRPNTKMVWIETPTNPLLTLIDIRAVAELAHANKLLVGVDNTFCSPYFQRPLELGADIIAHSTTKYINGHSDVVGGAVISKTADLHAKIAFHQNAVGSIPGVQDAFLTIRGAKTLALRMERHAQNAQRIAEWLTTRSDVAEVYYPGLPDHPQHALAKAQMSGFGGIVSFRIRGEETRALDIAKRTRLFNLATSLGGVESLICSPFTMTHGPVPVETKKAMGITLGLLRLSVGIEDIEDLIEDLDRALSASAPTVSVSTGELKSTALI